MNLEYVFAPKSIAIIGASTKEGSVGRDVARNLIEQGYTGKIYPVNPKATEMFGIPCYASISEVPNEVEMAVFAIPGQCVPSVMEEAAQKGIKGAVVISAGFKEAGNMELEQKLIEVCKKYDIALIGPNCLGVITPSLSMNASFAKIMPADGNVAFFSQSGALCTAVIDQALKLGIGFSKFVSMGNKAITKEADVLNFLAQDPDTKVVAMYVEDLEAPQEIIKAVKKISANGKPVIVLKSGRTKAGASASASHTGALAGNDSAYEALFSQAGIIRAYEIFELFDYAQAFANNPLPKGAKTVIVTNAGGPGVITTDTVLENDLTLAELGDSTKEKLSANLPPAANWHNPVDVLGDAKADRYKMALESVAQDTNVDSILVILTPQSMTEDEATAEAIIDVKHSSGKTIIASFMGNASVQKGISKLLENGIAHIEFPDRAAKALGKMCTFTNNLETQTKTEQFSFYDIDQTKVSEIIETAIKEGKRAFPEAEAQEILRAYGFPLLISQVVTSKEEAVEVGNKINRETVLKIVSPDILHKSDVGGVILNVSPEEIAAKYEELMHNIANNAPTAHIQGVLVMEMAPKEGEQLILGSIKDPALGNMLMVGLGGIYVEILKDVSFGLAPITKQDAKRMLTKLRTAKILEGTRGQQALDVDTLIETMGRLSQLLTDFPQIKEIDINPLLVLPQGKGVYVLDSRIILE
jgi:acetyltransferase